MFTCFVNYDESEENKVGAFRIMDLPEFDLFDGVICMKNSIQYEPAVNSLIARIKKSKVPAVSVDEKVDGMYNVGISDYSSQKDIVEHLIETHDLKKINYVCGILQGKEGRERYNAYRDAMEEHGMQRIAEDIKAAIKTADQKENRSYHLAASLGCSLHKSYEMDNLNSLIELADKKMYEEKKNKRR